jgi:hypothetical protein
MIKLSKTGFAVAAAIAVASCSVGSNKCGNGFYETQGACKKGVATGGTTSTAINDADLDGLAGDGSTETVTGMGDECTTQSDCAGKDANYCALDPTSGVGLCTIEDCTTSPDNCPSGYRCCQMPVELKYPAMCLPPTTYNMLVSLGYCPK